MHPSRHRISEIDSLRGIGALTIFLLHGKEYYLVHWQLLSMGYLGVDLFFILSGFVLAYVYQEAIYSGKTGLKEFAVSRFARLSAMHYVGMAVMTLAAFIVSDLTLLCHHDCMYSFFLSIFFLNNVGLHPLHEGWNKVSWSISCELVINFLWFFLAWRRWDKSWVLASLCFGTAIFLYTHSSTTINVVAWSIDGVINTGLLRCIISFTMGIIIFRHLNVALPMQHLWCNLLVCGLLVEIGYVGACWSEQRFLGFDYIIVLLFLPALLVLSLNNNSFLSPMLRSKPLIFLGDISYSFYMLHVALLHILDKYDGPIYNLGGKPLMFVSDLSIVIFLSYLSYRFIEIPSRYWIKQFFAKQLLQTTHSPA